jgi:O-acetyl-ADP-ribose deacetylase (regulator of RNase III)
MARYFEGDITTVSADAIVNNLGIVTTHQGALCRTILDAADSDILRDKIKELNGKIGVTEVYVSPKYNLQFTKYIIHAVTPHFDDDPDMTGFQCTLRNILMTAHEKGFKSLAIPMIGTGHDRYDKNAVHVMINSMCASFEKHIGGIDFILVFDDENLRHKLKSLKRKVEQMDGGGRHRDYALFAQSMNYFKDHTTFKKWNSYIYPKSFFLDSSSAKKQYGLFEDEENRKNVFVPLSDVKNAKDYINAYIKARYSAVKVQNSKINEVKYYLGYREYKKDAKSAKLSGKKSYYNWGKGIVPDEKNCFKVMLALRMNYDEASAFFTYNGHSFKGNGVSPLQDAVVHCLREHIYDILEIEKQINVVYHNDSLFS